IPPLSLRHESCVKTVGTHIALNERSHDHKTIRHTCASFVRICQLRSVCRVRRVLLDADVKEWLDRRSRYHHYWCRTCGSYFLGAKFAARATASVILAFAAGIGVIGFLTVPFDSTDVFFYIATGWEQAHYGGNPYSAMLRNVDGALHGPMINN